MRIVFLFVLDYRCNNDATAMITNILYCVLSVIQGIALNTGILPFSKGRVLQAPGTKGTKSKAVERDGFRGSWFPCKPDDGPMKLLVDEGFLKRDLFHYTLDEATPVPPSGFIVMCRAWMDCGLSLPPAKFFLDELKLY